MNALITLCFSAQTSNALEEASTVPLPLPFDRPLPEKRLLLPALVRVGCSVGPYQLEQQIGVGSCARVFKAVHKSTRQKFAVKALPSSPCDGVTKPETEKEILSLVHEHTNIASLHQYIRAPGQRFLVQQLGQVDLLEHMSQRGHLPELRVQQIFAQVLSAVAHLHAKNVAWRDAKAENVLLSKFGDALICDFGFARRYNLNERCRERCGTPNYAAPELITFNDGDRGFDPFAADIWACGVLLFLLLNGRLPFASSTPHRMFSKIVDGRYEFDYHVTPPGRDLVNLMLAPDAGQRPTAQQLVSHPFLASQAAIAGSDSV